MRIETWRWADRVRPRVGEREERVGAGHGRGLRDFSMEGVKAGQAEGTCKEQFSASYFLFYCFISCDRGNA